MTNTDHLSALHEESNGRLLSLLPKDQLCRVLESGWCDIDPSFLGFVGIYERLAQIIPPHWTVVDLGCAYAPQAFFFTGHEAYIGVDCMAEERFVAHNTTHHHMTIGDFIAQHGASFDRETTFAICSYVPCWDGEQRSVVQGAFANVFTFYPATPAYLDRSFSPHL